MIWERLKHFKRNENWGDPDKMDTHFLVQLDNYRDSLPFSFLVMEGFATSGHSSGSLHYKGRAVDGRFMDKSRKVLSLKDHIMIALKSPFGGVGIYTWGSGGPFLHFDDRDQEFGRKIWVSTQPNKYENLSIEWIINSNNL